MLKKRKGECSLEGITNSTEGLLCFVLDNASDGFVLLDADDNVLLINKKFEEWTCFSDSEWKYKQFPWNSFLVESSEKILLSTHLRTCREEGKEIEFTFSFKYKSESLHRKLNVRFIAYQRNICCKFSQMEHFTYTDKQILEFYEFADPFLPEFSVGRYDPEKDDVLSMFSSLRAAKKKKEIGCNQLYNRYYLADLQFSNARQWVDCIATVGPDNPSVSWESLIAYSGGPDVYLFMTSYFVKEDEFGRKMVVTMSDPGARTQAHLTKQNVQKLSEISNSVKNMFDHPSLISGTLELVEDATDILLKLQTGSKFLNASSTPRTLSQLGWTRDDIEVWLAKCSECTPGKSVIFEFQPQHDSEQGFRCLLFHISSNCFAFILDSLSVRIQLESILEQHKRDLETQIHKYTKELDEALQVKSRFLAMMSHEMRTPLSGVLATLSLIRDTPLDAEQKELVRIGEVCGQQLLLVINDVLDYGKLDANKVVLEAVPFHLKNSLEESVEVVSFEAHTKGIELITCIDPSVPSSIVGDPGRLRQILVNLLSNAVKFSLQGEVVLTAKAISSNNNNVDFIEISVKDEGIGIEDSQKHKLFQAFSQVDGSATRRHAGTGLGLSISKRLAELMGGKMWFVSKLGVGSTFYVQLPIIRDSLSVLVSSSMQIDLHSNIPSIMIVDKSQTVLTHLENLLEHRGFKCFCTNSVEEAIKQHNGYFKLVLVDSKFPQERIQALQQLHGVESFYILGISLYSKQQNLPSIRKPVTENSLFKIVYKEHNMHYEDTKRSSISSEPSSKKLSLADVVPTYKILLAEDNTLNQQIIVKMLSSVGFMKHNISVVSNGKQAVEFVRNCHQNGRKIDIILMDVMMPEMSGIEATELIRSEFGNEPVIVALTANVFAEDKIKFLQSGMQGVLTKPVNKQELIDSFLKFASEK